MTHPIPDETHDPALISWVESAHGHADFPLQNLPLGRFSHGTGDIRVGVAIGDAIVDLQALLATGLLAPECAAAARAAGSGAPNAMMALASAERLALRRGLSQLLTASGPGADAARRRSAEFLREAALCRMHLPASIGNFSDFNAGIHHASNGGRRRGLAHPLLPNYRHMPIGYHGRASSIRPSGVDVRRPWGQARPSPEQGPVFAPTRKLDFELEIGVWIARGNTLGQPVPVGEAHDHIAGYCLLNDWSARDLQAWESERLGPFLGKSFATTASPWVVSPEALAPFRLPAYARTGDDPTPLDYLLDAQDQLGGNLALELQILISSARQRGAGHASAHVSTTHARHLFWTPAQMLAHQTSNGCDLLPGDLLGTGTVTGPDPDSFGTLLDALSPERSALKVGDELRTFLEDGDEVIFRARTSADGFVPIGFGSCHACVLPALAAAAP